MRVLLFSNDLMPFGNLPTSGGGLRCYQLLKGLESRGVEVITSMPGFTFLAEKHYDEIPEEQREWLWRWETQDALLQKAKPDAVLFSSNWDHFNLTKTEDVPVIIDLHGCRLLETSMWGNPVSTDHLVKVFGKADCLLCAGVRQRLYFYGWLLQAGRVPEAEHFIRYIPISLSPELPVRTFPETFSGSLPQIVSGGGWFPWQNQSTAIYEFCRSVKERDAGRLDIFGTPHDTNTVTEEERVIRNVYAEVKRLSEASDRIAVHGYVGRSDLVERYAKASVALECMEYNLERELAFTTRTIEYLWCGLPVVYNNYAEISSHISEFDAGWTIDPTNKVEINRVIDEIFSSPAVVAKKGMNAQRLVRERFTWDQTIQPLMDFLERPERAKPAQPVTGAAYSLPTFLSPRGTLVDVPLHADSWGLTQSFLVPADGILFLEIPYIFDRQALLRSATELMPKPAKHSTGEPAAPEILGSIKCRVWDNQGRSILSTDFKVTDLLDQGVLTLRFSSWRQPLGGSELKLQVALEAPEGLMKRVPGDFVFLKGAVDCSFPYLPQHQQSLVGIGLGGLDAEAKTLALTFIPGQPQLARVKAIAVRAVQMIRQGEWTRLRAAITRRVPELKARLGL